MAKQPKKGTTLRMKQTHEATPEFVANHGYLYTYLGRYPATTLLGHMYRVRSIASGKVVHMFDYELEQADE